MLVKSLLILCREETSDVIELADALIERGIPTIYGKPCEITVDMDKSGIRFIYNHRILDLSCVLGWVSLSQREYGLWLLKAFEICGIPVINDSEVLGSGQNKFLNSVLLTQHEIPHIPTRFIGTCEQLEETADLLGFPLVLKPVIGAKGQQVVRVDDIHSLRNLAPYYLRDHKALYVQACLDKPGRDIRVRVVDYKADFAFFRYAENGSFLTNLSIGGTWAVCPLTQRMIELAELCSRVFHAPVAGVDLLEVGDDDYAVIEVNTTPAITWPHMETVRYVADLIEQRVHLSFQEKVRNGSSS
ncbi:ATP-grasp domain-containing protein [Paenibacillus amylolyticus]|uniref:ATP-grasp domain-containing protein n=1 Tax=Paenibacillus amylolyticus TaxID=1451 RepID=UPI003EBCFE73